MMIEDTKAAVLHIVYGANWHHIHVQITLKFSIFITNFRKLSKEFRWIHNFTFTSVLKV
jgi:hypothetical protein